MGGALTRLFSQAEVLRVLQGFNPWWARRTVAVPAFRRDVHAACMAHVDGVRHRTVLLLSGMRGAGKTTTLLQVAADLVERGADPRSIIYLSVEHPIFATLPLAEILRLYRSTIHPEEHAAVLLLDEVHYARDWDAQVKELLLDSTGYQIIATESVRLIEQALVTETQMGRWATVEVPSLSFAEYLRLRGTAPTPPAEGFPEVSRLARLPPVLLERLAQALAPVQAEFRNYLVSGGLPALAAAGEGARALLHEDIAERALRRDIALHTGARNLDELKRLFMYLCVHSGEVFPVQRYARLIGASPSTVASHLGLLEQCFLVTRLPPIGLAGETIEKPRYKVFISDASLRSVQLLEDAADRTDPEDLRRSIVTCVARHVVRRFERGLARIGYWRDSRTLLDLDLVVHEDGDVRVFHLADRGAPQRRDPIVSFCRKTRVPFAVLVTHGRGEITATRLPGVDTVFLRVPAAALVYLLGIEESHGRTT